MYGIHIDGNLCPDYLYVFQKRVFRLITYVAHIPAYLISTRKLSNHCLYLLFIHSCVSTHTCIVGCKILNSLLSDFKPADFISNSHRFTLRDTRLLRYNRDVLHHSIAATLNVLLPIYIRCAVKARTFFVLRHSWELNHFFFLLLFFVCFSLLSFPLFFSAHYDKHFFARCNQLQPIKHVYYALTWAEIIMAIEHSCPGYTSHLLYAQPAGLRQQPLLKTGLSTLAGITPFLNMLSWLLVVCFAKTWANVLCTDLKSGKTPKQAVISLSMYLHILYTLYIYIIYTCTSYIW